MPSPSLLWGLKFSSAQLTISWNELRKGWIYRNLEKRIQYVFLNLWRVHSSDCVLHRRRWGRYPESCLKLGLESVIKKEIYVGGHKAAK